MYELILECSEFFRIEQTKSDYYLITNTNFPILPGHTQLNTKIEVIFDDHFLCLLQLEQLAVNNGILQQHTSFPNNYLTIDVVNLNSEPFFVAENTKLAKINFITKQTLDTFFLYKTNNNN